MKHILLIAGLIFTYTIGYSQDVSWDSYTHVDYAINYPAEWEFQSPGPMGTKFAILSPVESDTDLFKENVNLFIEELGSTNVSLDQYVEFSEKQIPAMLTGVEFTGSERKKNEQGEYHALTYTFNQGQYNLKLRQQCYIKDGIAYVLTFSSDINSFNTFIPLAQKILDSFEFK